MWEFLHYIVLAKAEEMVKKAEEITGEKVLHTSVQTEPLGPKKMCDVILIKNTHIRKILE